jgi:OmpA-OmpF porin, OOP family
VYTIEVTDPARQAGLRSFKVGDTITAVAGGIDHPGSQEPVMKSDEGRHQSQGWTQNYSNRFRLARGGIKMKRRHVLLATSILALPLGARAQMVAEQPLGYPVSGLYIGAAGGFNLKGNESIKNLSSNLRTLSSGLSTPNLNVGSSTGAVGIGSIGYGLGNGLRLEAEFDYRGNSFNNLSGTNRAGFGASTGVTGTEKVWGPMFNVAYDFVGLAPWIVPYVGAGIGYQRAHLGNFSAFGTGVAGALAPALTSNDTRASFAAQGIIGAAFPIPQVLGLSLTAEYRILALTGTRTYDAGLGVTTPAGRVNRFGTMQWGHQYNNSFLFGVRYNFGVTPPPPPPAPVAAPAPAPARSYLVFFDWDKATLSDRARQIIREAAENSTHVQYTRIEVNGYTDTSGTSQYNMGLSIRRARAVAAELVADGVPQSAISIQGFGETHLLVPTGPGVREPQNRRVEIIIR